MTPDEIAKKIEVISIDYFGFCAAHGYDNKAFKYPVTAVAELIEKEISAKVEECCRAVCQDCAEGRPTHVSHDGHSCHDSKMFKEHGYLCQATAIRRLSASQSREKEGETK